ncbi:MAG: hypothetical protein IT161_13780 [Bryobacterales bacterium]|nr:hypothetical protein [Bryobacterales bacterium]
MKKHASPQVAAQPCILMIGPDDPQRSLLRSTLLAAGCRTLICARRRDANDLIRFASVVICEHSLPDGSWRDVLQCAEMLERAPAVIVTSRLAAGDPRTEVLSLGGYGVLDRPFCAKDVMGIVRKAHNRWLSLSETGAVRASALPGRIACETHAFR